MVGWVVERIVHFDPGELVRDGHVHFGFHDRSGRQYAIDEVTGCRIWRFDEAGRPVETLGDGTPGFQLEAASFDTVRFSWIYDFRRGPGGSLYVLDSRNFALRAIDVAERTVSTFAGNGTPGYGGDGGDARSATFGSDPAAPFDGPISLSIDESGNAFVGDGFNHVVRMIERDSGLITTIAGRPLADPERANDPATRDALQLNLPTISSMDYDRGRLFVPTDLAGDSGDLVVLRRTNAGAEPGHPRKRYFANSSARVSRMTVTLI